MSKRHYYMEQEKNAQIICKKEEVFMVKTMVITNDIFLLDNLLVEFEKNKMKVQLVKISTSKEETLKYLQGAEPDLVLFDEVVRNDYDKNFFRTYNIRSTTVRNNKNGLISKNTIDNIKDLIKEVDVDMKRISGVGI